MAWRPSDADRARAEARVARVEKAVAAVLKRLLARQERIGAERLRSTQFRKGTWLWDPPGDAEPDWDALLPAERWELEARPELEELVDGLAEEFMAASGIVTEQKAEPKYHELGLADALMEGVKAVRQGLVDRLTRKGRTEHDLKALTEELHEAFKYARSEQADFAAQAQGAGVANALAMVAASDAGATHKFWLSARDNRVRLHHADADGQVVPITKKFKVGAADMAFPGDKRAPLGEWINCRCSLLFVARPDLKVVGDVETKVRVRGNYPEPHGFTSRTPRVRRVRTPEGQRRYGVPIGSPIPKRVGRRGGVIDLRAWHMSVTGSHPPRTGWVHVGDRRAAESRRDQIKDALDERKIRDSIREGGYEADPGEIRRLTEHHLLHGQPYDPVLNQVHVTGPSLNQSDPGYIKGNTNGTVTDWFANLVTAGKKWVDQDEAREKHGWDGNPLDVEPNYGKVQVPMSREERLEAAEKRLRDIETRYPMSSLEAMYAPAERNVLDQLKAGQEGAIYYDNTGERSDEPSVVAPASQVQVEGHANKPRPRPVGRLLEQLYPDLVVPDPDLNTGNDWADALVQEFGEFTTVPPDGLAYLTPDGRWVPVESHGDAVDELMYVNENLDPSELADGEYDRYIHGLVEDAESPRVIRSVRHTYDPATRESGVAGFEVAIDWVAPLTPAQVEAFVKLADGAIAVYGERQEGWRSSHEGGWFRLGENQEGDREPFTSADLREALRRLDDPGETKAAKKPRRVRTPEGARHFGQPIGTPIAPGVGRRHFGGHQELELDSLADRLIANRDVLKDPTWRARVNKLEAYGDTPDERVATVVRRAIEIVEANKPHANKPDLSRPLGGEANRKPGQGPLYYHGSDDRPPSLTGNEDWDRRFFVSHDPEVARLYGKHLRLVRMAPDTRVLVQGSPEFQEMAKDTGEEGLLGHYTEIVRRAEAAGYDVVEFHRPHDYVGHVIINQDKIERPRPAYADKIELVSTAALRKMADPNVDLDKMAEQEASYLDTLSRRLVGGMQEPIVIGYDPDTKTAIITDGHHRILAAEALGWTHLPTRVVRYRHGRAGVPVRGYEEEGHLPEDLRPSQVGISNIGPPAELENRPAVTYNPEYGEESYAPTWLDEFEEIEKRRKPKVPKLRGQDVVDFGPAFSNRPTPKPESWQRRSWRDPAALAAALEYARKGFESKPLDGSQRAAVVNYQNYGFERVNSFLRSGRGDWSKPANQYSTDIFKESVAEVVEGLDAAVEGSRTTVPMVVYRGMSYKDVARLRRMKPGAILTDRDYASTSLLRSVASHSGEVVEVVIPAGSPALSMSLMGDPAFKEAEVLLPRGSQFRVVSSDPLRVVVVT